MKPVIIAGPCMAESPEIMAEVASIMGPAMKKLGVDYYFKASFDKANRTSKVSARGPGMRTGLRWLGDIASQYKLRTLSDVHETTQCQPVAEVCDALQIPAMLCRQTDLVVTAAECASKLGRSLNIKKGQFLSPYAMSHIADKAAKSGMLQKDVWICERGSMFGYGDLVVDMRGLKVMAQSGYPTILDMTHCNQKPPHGKASKSGAEREFAPMLARAAAATGYLSGLFLEVHPDPSKALSDGPCMLTPSQAILAVKTVLNIMDRAEIWKVQDKDIKSCT